MRFSIVPVIFFASLASALPPNSVDSPAAPPHVAERQVTNQEIYTPVPLARRQVSAELPYTPLPNALAGRQVSAELPYTPLPNALAGRHVSTAPDHIRARATPAPQARNAEPEAEPQNSAIPIDKAPYRA